MPTAELQEMLHEVGIDEDQDGCITEDEWKAMQKKIKDIVMDAVDFAENAADPDPETELVTDTYALPMKNLSPSETYHHGAKNPLL